jgi:hypothetical protein
MKLSEPYRGIKYSVSDTGDGTWEWKLYPPITHGVVSNIVSGTVRGTEDDAMAAAERAIDE